MLNARCQRKRHICQRKQKTTMRRTAEVEQVLLDYGRTASTPVSHRFYLNAKKACKRIISYFFNYALHSFASLFLVPNESGVAPFT